MRMLPITEGEKERAAELRAFAEHPDHWYWPERRGRVVPGDDKRYTRKFGSCRVVFSITASEAGKVGRHLTVSSVDRPRQVMPHPLEVFTIAHWLGFTHVEPDEHGLVHDPGWDWLVGGKENTVDVVQHVIVGQWLTPDEIQELRARKPAGHA